MPFNYVHGFRNCFPDISPKIYPGYSAEIQIARSEFLKCKTFVLTCTRKTRTRAMLLIFTVPTFFRYDETVAFALATSAPLVFHTHNQQQWGRKGHTLKPTGRSDRLRDLSLIMQNICRAYEQSVVGCQRSYGRPLYHRCCMRLSLSRPFFSTELAGRMHGVVTMVCFASKRKREVMRECSKFETEHLNESRSGGQ